MFSLYMEINDLIYEDALSVKYMKEMISKQADSSLEPCNPSFFMLTNVNLKIVSFFSKNTLYFIFTYEHNHPILITVEMLEKTSRYSRDLIYILLVEIFSHTDVLLYIIDYISDAHLFKINNNVSIWSKIAAIMKIDQIEKLFLQMMTKNFIEKENIKFPLIIDYDSMNDIINFFVTLSEYEPD